MSPGLAGNRANDAGRQRTHHGSRTKRLMNVIQKSNCPEFIAQDNAKVREIASPRNSPVENQSLAEVIIPPGVTILEHYHEKTEELYFIQEGVGLMSIEGEEKTVRKNDCVIILPGQMHKIKNPGDSELIMLVSCSPSYRDEDQFLC